MVNFTNIKYQHCTIIFPTNCGLFKDKVLPSDNVLSSNYEDAKKLLKMLGVEYISYHACEKDCILYRGEYADKEICLKCGHEKYGNFKKAGKSHGPPHKILSHVPITPRIQRLFH